MKMYGLGMRKKRRNYEEKPPPKPEKIFNFGEEKWKCLKKVENFLPQIRP